MGNSTGNTHHFTSLSRGLLVYYSWKADGCPWVSRNITKDNARISDDGSRCRPQYSRFNTRTYAVIFVCGDVLSLVVQALGGAIAAGADTLEAANHGSDVMVSFVCLPADAR